MRYIERLASRPAHRAATSCHRDGAL